MNEQTVDQKLTGYCQSCGAHGPRTDVEFNYNVGALVMRWHKTIKGYFCMGCINRWFWNYTLINLLLGWWGIISFFVTPVFIVMNGVNYGRAIARLGAPWKQRWRSP